MIIKIQQKINMDYQAESVTQRNITPESSKIGIPFIFQKIRKDIIL